MTVKEMHYDFKLKADKVDSLAKEDFNVAEIDWLLNEAQWVLLKTKYGINNKYNIGFEGNQKRIDDLATLHVKYPLQPGIQPTNIGTGIADTTVWELDLSALKFDYLYLTRAYADVILTNCTKQASLRPIDNDDLNTVLVDPFNKPNYNQIPINFGKSTDETSNIPSIYLYTNDTLGKVYVEYLKVPARINFGDYEYIDGVTYPTQDCELPTGVHPELVDTAVALAAGLMESKQYIQMRFQKLMMNE